MTHPQYGRQPAGQPHPGPGQQAGQPVAAQGYPPQGGPQQYQQPGQYPPGYGHPQGPPAGYGPPPQYAQPGYPPAGYPAPGYPQQAYAQPGPPPAQVNQPLPHGVFQAKFRKHTGMIILAQWRDVIVTGSYDDVRKAFWQAQTHCLTLGWWGLLSALVYNWIAIIGNISEMGRITQQARQQGLGG